jgi:hypothetical protein
VSRLWKHGAHHNGEFGSRIIDTGPCPEPNQSIRESGLPYVHFGVENNVFHEVSLPEFCERFLFLLSTCIAYPKSPHSITMKFRSSTCVCLRGVVLTHRDTCDHVQASEFELGRPPRSPLLLTNGQSSCMVDTFTMSSSGECQ